MPIALSTADKDLPGYFLMTNTLDYFKKNFKAAKIVIVKKNATFKPAHYIDEPKFSIEIPGFDPLLESDVMCRFQQLKTRVETLTEKNKSAAKEFISRHDR